MNTYYEDDYVTIYHGDCRDVLPNIRYGSCDLFLADPPYGMGKEKDGVANDNLYREKLDRFIMDCITAAWPVLKNNASLYIWGNAEDLWRLWYCGGLGAVDGLVFRNELVWDKGNGMGMNSELHHQYATVTERCLFLMMGQQFLGSANKDEFWEGYEPLREWLCQQRDMAGWRSGDINRITGTYMAGHWFSKSQFAVIPQNHYETLRAATTSGAFSLEYGEVVALISSDGKSDYNKTRQDAVKEMRSYFNNTHDVMSDVWSFPRVVGSDRLGHPTPKPQGMIGRCISTSAPVHGMVLDPFMGSGTTLRAAKDLQRKAIGIELEEKYCEIAAKRMAQEVLPL